MAERIEGRRRAERWPVNDVILRALLLRAGLGGERALRAAHPQDIAQLRGAWNPAETAAFREALNAFEHVDGAPA